MPDAQQSKLCALTILAMAKIRQDDSFNVATNDWIRIHDVIAFVNANYGMDYAENTRETFRKHAMHHFRTAAIIEDNGEATNSPNYKYRITNEFLEVLKMLAEDDSASGIENVASLFLSNHSKLIDIYASKRKIRKLPVKINSKDYAFSPGLHNKLQKAILEEFAPRFAPHSECLYVGDTVNKNLINDSHKLAELEFEISIHNKLPDVILYREDKDWLYFIEAVVSGGPMSPERVKDIKTMTANVKSGKIFITAFLTLSKYKRFYDSLAWETEVWIADFPEHMIHLNGDKFLGPR